MFDERREQRAAEDEAIDDREVPDPQDTAQDEVGGVPTVRLAGVLLLEPQRMTVARILGEGAGPCQIVMHEDCVTVLDSHDLTVWAVDETGLAQREELPF